MMVINFKDLKRSELIKSAIFEKLQDDLERFPELQTSRIKITVAMDNSPHQAGPDLFRIRLHIANGRFRGIVLEKSARSFYTALGDLNESLLERLNRHGDKVRVAERRNARRLSHRWAGNLVNAK